jgi:hypothetical protein
LRIPWGNRGSGVSRFPAGAAIIPLAGVSRCVAARAARRRSIRAWRERWPEHRRRRGADGPAASAGVGAGASAAGVVGTGPGPVDRHGWSSSHALVGRAGVTSRAGGGGPTRASSEAESRTRGRPALERGRVSPEGASGPQARRSFARGGVPPSSEAEFHLRGRWGRLLAGPLALVGPWL